MAHRFRHTSAQSKVAKGMAGSPAAMNYWLGSAGASRERASGEAGAYHEKQKRSHKHQRLKALARDKKKTYRKKIAKVMHKSSRRMP